MRLLGIRSLSLKDHAFFEQAIRANEIGGVALLTSIDQVSLRDDLGFKALGPRAIVMVMINKLRGRSRQYLDYVQSVASYTPLPHYNSVSGHISTSGFDPPYYASLNHSSVRPMPASNQLLQSPVLSPDRQQPGPLNLTMLDETPSQVQRHSIQPENNRLIRGSEPLKPDTISSDPQQVPREEQQEHPSDTSAVSQQQSLDVTASRLETHRQLSTSTGITTLDDDFQPTEILNVARRGETYIVDDSGRKRRRLVLGAVKTPDPVLIDQGILPTTHEQNTLPRDDYPGDHDIGNDHEAEHNQLEDITTADNDQRVDQGVDSIVSLANSITTSPQPLVLHTPGKLVIDAQGRKRMRPLLVSEPKSIHESISDASLPSVNQEAEDASLQPDLSGEKSRILKISESSRFSSDRPAYQGYLGPKSFAVDDVFYSDTPLGQELHNESHYDAPSDTHRQTEPETYVFTAVGDWCNGQRIWMHNRIKSFLYSREIKTFRRKGQSFVLDIPYHGRIVKKHQMQSLTLFSNFSGAVIAQRVDRSKWLRSGPIPGSKARSSHDQGTFTDHFNGPEEDLLALDPGFEERYDWDFLEKWRYQENADKVLPLYGDSGSEGEYDLDTWQEIEDEAGTLSRPLGRSKSRHLDSEKVLAAIDAAMEYIIAKWKETKLPQLEPRARRIWLKSRRDRNKRELIKDAMRLIEDRSNRLVKLKQAITEEVWSSQQQIEKQCKCMQESIFEKEESSWKISVWESRTVPPKPPSDPEKKSKPAKVPSMHDSLGDDEEDLGSTGSAAESSDDEGLDDFIVSDEDIEDSHSMNNLDKPHAVDEQGSGPENYPAIEEDSDDEIVTTLARRRRQHVEAEDTTVVARGTATRSPEPQIDDDFPQDGMISASSSEGADASSPYADSSPESSSSQAVSRLPHDRPSLPTHPRILPIQYHDVIDLTQASDSVAPETPGPKPESFLEIRTPPLLPEDDDPFRRTRKMESEFKLPPLNPNVIDLENEFAHSTSREEGTKLPPKKLPELWEVSKIVRLPVSFLVERQDRKRLLVWTIGRTSPLERERIIARTQVVAMELNQSGIVSALKALKAHAFRIRGEDKSSSEVLIWMAGWYISFSQCVYWSHQDGIAAKHVEQTLKDMEGFEHFYEFLLECLKRYEAPPISRTPEKGTYFERDSKRPES